MDGEYTFCKEKFIGRVVRGRLTQPIEEEEVGAAHLIQEKKAGEKKTIEAILQTTVKF